MRKILALFLISSLWFNLYAFAEEKDIVIRVVCPDNKTEFEKIIRLKSEDVKKLHKEDKNISKKLNDKAIVVRSDAVDNLDEKILNEELKNIENKKDKYKYQLERKKVKKFRVDDGYSPPTTSTADDEIDRILNETKSKEVNKAESTTSTPARKKTSTSTNTTVSEEPKFPTKISVFADENQPTKNDCDYLVYYNIYNKVIQYKDILELSKKQVSLIEVYHLELKEKAQKIKKDIKYLEKRLDNMVLQPVRPRVEDIKVLLIKIAKLKVNLAVLNIKEALIIKKILTPKQWKTLIKLIKK
jgi:hypothetical protein